MCRGKAASCRFGYREYATDSLVDMKGIVEELILSLKRFGGLLYSGRLAEAEEKYEAIRWELTERKIG